MPLSSGLPLNRIARREAIIHELRRLDADVVCMQEIWIGQDVERIVRELSDLYSFSFSKLHLPGKLGGFLPSQEGPSMPPCNSFHIDEFTSCARRNKCIRRKYTRGQISACISFHCYYQFEMLSQKCVSCMVVGFSNMRSMYQKCAGIGLPAINMRTMNEPGLLLLSKRPLVNARYTDFHPYTKEMIERGHIEADTEDLGKVVCTHNTADSHEYTELELSRRGIYSSFLEQGHSERTQLIKKFGHTYPLVLAGDFNTGDAFGPLINQEVPQEFSHLARAFDVSPLKQCTFCWPHENIYTKTTSAAQNSVIDHVFYKGHKVVKMLRVFTTDDAILMDNLPLSDHNGVLAVFSLC